MVATIVASMSGMTRHSRTCTPSSPSSVARYWMLESRVRPLRISLPMTTIQAVTIFASSDIPTLIFLFFQYISGGTPEVHGPEGFEGMRRAGRRAAETLDFITSHVQPGISTAELDKLCHDYILDHKA